MDASYTPEKDGTFFIGITADGNNMIKGLTRKFINRLGTLT